jgi:site-specific recombinase XerD
VSRDRPNPEDLKIRDARDRYLRRRRPDAADRSLHTWQYRLKLFADWCESVGIIRVGDLKRYDLDEFYEFRSADIAPATLEGEMWTLKMFIRFLEDIGAVEDGLASAVRIPDLDQSERTDDTKLHTDAAIALLQYYRNSSKHYGSRLHAFFELAWVTGARVGGIRGLDLQDCHFGENPYVEFRHRPDTDTPLKNKMRGERPVALKRVTADALQTYVGTKRYNVRDDFGRQPLLASTRGRPVENTIRTWCYMSTLPCLHSECPHGKARETCDFVDPHYASKCPSSRSPHQIRTGAITYLLNAGWPPEDVAERVNSAVETIEQHYDKADPEQRRRRMRDRMEDRRRSLVRKTEFQHDK